MVQKPSNQNLMGSGFKGPGQGWFQRASGMMPPKDTQINTYSSMWYITPKNPHGSRKMVPITEDGSIPP